MCRRLKAASVDAARLVVAAAAAAALLVATFALTGLGLHDRARADSTPTTTRPSLTVLDVAQVPSLSTVASGAVTIGGAVSDTAVLDGGNNPTGSVTFQLFGPADPTCSGRPVYRSTVAVNGNGIYRSPSHVPARPGLYQWSAAYGGDADNLPLPAICPSGGESVAVLIGVPTLVTTTSASVTLGGTLTDSAVVAGGSKPTGVLTFTLFGPGDATCAGPPVLTFPPVILAGDGIYRSVPFTPTAPGTYRFEVRYSGDANNLALSTRCGTTSQASIVALAEPTISGLLPSRAPVGRQVVGTEVLAGGDMPTGTMILTVFGPDDLACAGVPAFTSPAVAVTGNGAIAWPPFTPEAPGFYTFVATYSGDTDNSGRQTRCGAPDQTLSVSRAIPTVSASAALHTPVGESVSTVETISDGIHPTGTVSFRFFGPNDPTCTGRPLFASRPLPVAGNGTYHSPPFTPPTPGNYRYVASYSGDARNTASTTDCNATNQAVLVSALYIPADHPRSVIELEIAVFALLALAGPGGTGRASRQMTTSPDGSAPPGSAPTGGSGAAGAAASQGSVVSTGLDNSAEGWESVAVVGATSATGERLNRGDRSRTWHWPGTGRIDVLSLTVPQRVAPASPLIARVTNDAGYLRAMFGAPSALLPFAGVTLAVVAVLDVHGQALPPSFLIATTLAVLGVLDALTGFIAVAVFVIGVIALGGLSTSNDARTLLGLSSLWFAAPIIAGVARPLRRSPTRSPAQHTERCADIIIAALVGAWAVKEIIGGLPGLSGRVLPLADHANAAALIVLAALGARMVVETIAAHHYPARLTDVQPEALPGSGKAQHVSSALVGLAVFLFVALPYVGSSWQLYLGGALFAVPVLLKVYADRLPNFSKLYAVMPRGIVQTVVLLVVGTAFGAFVAGHLDNQNSQQVIRESFLLISLPALAVSLLQLFGREGPEPPKFHWLAEKALGAAVVAIGALFVIGAVTI